MSDSDRQARSEPSISAARSSHSPVVDRRVQSHIGDKLRTMYDTLLGQPIPDRFITLLDQLEQSHSILTREQDKNDGA